MAALSTKGSAFSAIRCATTRISLTSFSPVFWLVAPCWPPKIPSTQLLLETRFVLDLIEPNLNRSLFSIVAASNATNWYCKRRNQANMLTVLLTDSQVLWRVLHGRVHNRDRVQGRVIWHGTAQGLVLSRCFQLTRHARCGRFHSFLRSRVICFVYLRLSLGFYFFNFWPEFKIH